MRFSEKSNVLLVCEKLVYIGHPNILMLNRGLTMTAYFFLFSGCIFYNRMNPLNIR